MNPGTGMAHPQAAVGSRGARISAATATNYKEADVIIEYATRLIAAGPVKQREPGPATPGAATDTAGSAL